MSISDLLFSANWTPFNNCRQSHHGNRAHLARLLGDKMADTVQGAADSSGYNSSGEEDSEASEGTPLELYGRREPLSTSPPQYGHV